MDLLTIGSFARAARLSPKALRLYDELGLLRPAYVDPVSGYRFYDPGQLEHARLVAWLRRLGMPLARTRVVCELPALAAAREISAYWSGVESATAARRTWPAFSSTTCPGRTLPCLMRTRPSESAMPCVRTSACTAS
jgi:protein phosphatase